MIVLMQASLPAIISQVKDQKSCQAVLQRTVASAHERSQAVLGRRPLESVRAMQCRASAGVF